MKRISRIILSALLLLVPICTFAQEDRFVKGLAHTDLMLGGCGGWNIGAGIHFGKSAHRVNLQTSINYSRVVKNDVSSQGENNYVNNTAPKENYNEAIRYSRISVPVELHIKFLDVFFAGAGAVYNYNMNGRIFDITDKENTTTALTDAVNAHNFAGRICAGMKLKSFEKFTIGLKIYTDINITPPLKKYSVNDRLFEYKGAIKKSLGKVTFGMAAFCTF